MGEEKKAISNTFGISKAFETKKFGSSFSVKVFIADYSFLNISRYINARFLKLLIDMDIAMAQL